MIDIYIFIKYIISKYLFSKMKNETIELAKKKKLRIYNLAQKQMNC